MIVRPRDHADAVARETARAACLRPRTALLCLPADPCCSRSASPFIVASQPVRWPITRPLLPRTSSSGSGFFFCGIRLLPVAARIGELEEAELLRREEDEVFGDAAQMHHRRATRACRNEATKSRSPVRRCCCATMRQKPSASASACDVDRRSWCRQSRRSRAAARRLRRAPSRSGRRRGAARRACERKKCATSTGCARRKCVYDGISASPRALGLRRRARATSRGDRALDLGNAPLQVQAQIDRDLLVARAAGVQAAPGVADPRDELALDERVNVFVARGASDDEERGSSSPCGRDVLRAPRAIAAASAAVSTPACSSASAHARLPRTSSSNSRRSKLNDGAELEQRRVGIAGEPSGPEMRHRQRSTALDGSPLARRGFGRQAPDLDEPFRGAWSKRSPAS